MTSPEHAQYLDECIIFSLHVYEWFDEGKWLPDRLRQLSAKSEAGLFIEQQLRGNNAHLDAITRVNESDHPYTLFRMYYAQGMFGGWR